MTPQQLSAVGGPVVVAIPAELKLRLDLLIAECKFEISGLGEVEIIDGVLTITAIHLLDQEVSSSQTTLDSKAVLAFVAAARERGIDPEKLRLWWHSHANGTLHWSSTDETCIENSTSPWLISIEGNHAGDYIARFDFLPTEELPVRMAHQAVLTVIYPQHQIEAIQGEILDRVREARPKRTKKEPPKPVQPGQLAVKSVVTRAPAKRS